MDKKKIYDYIMNTPHNTNPNVLSSLLNEPVSWNDLTDKPFYEETTTVAGDTLTWDGNTEGLVNANNVFYKVSDALPNESDFSNRYIIVGSGGETIEVTKEEYGEDFAIAAPGILMGMSFVVVYEAGTEFGGEMTFPETGLYVYNDDELYLASLTIPGYTGFVSKQTVVKPIDTKYLPEHLQFGETVVKGDTLTWDGNTDGLELFGEMFYRVTDKAPSLDECKNGITGCYFNYSQTGQTSTEDFALTYDEISGNMMGDAFSTDGLLIVMQDTTIQGITLKKGIYLGKEIGFNNQGDSYYVSRVTIPGYGGFESKTIKPMDEKYMPILTSPSGKKFKLSVDDSGAVTATEV